MSQNLFNLPDADVAWCPGCGNFAMWRIVKESLSELNLRPENVIIVSGIGQAAKLPQYINAHMFNGLHGRSLAVGLAINACNPKVKVIVHSGDGCTYGEGGNHFLHQILRNPNLTNIIHNNMIYGLTKGQGSPTSPKGLKTTVQFDGVTNEPLNPVALAISQGATFVARMFVGDLTQSKEIYKKALQHHGYALIDAFCPCVIYNQFNSFKWYKDHCYYLDSSYNFKDQNVALIKAMETEKFPLGVIYNGPSKPTFPENTGIYTHDDSPLYTREVDLEKLQNLILSKRSI